tara:strand:- start:716 stop:943 length:228 start_codon:yes stop_codon:yes gene_type:complete
MELIYIINKWESNMIKINGIDGYYYVEDDCLIYYCIDLQDDVEVSDLTELTVHQYNELNNKLVETFNYNLNGRFI